MFEFASSDETYELSATDPIAMAGETAGPSIEIGSLFDDERYSDETLEESANTSSHTNEVDSTSEELPRLGALALGDTDTDPTGKDDSTAETGITTSADAKAIASESANQPIEQTPPQIFETKEPGRQPTNLQPDIPPKDPLNTEDISAPESASVIPEAQDGSNSETEQNVKAEADKQGYQTHINEPGVPSETNTQMVRRERLAKQIDDAFWHSVQNPQEEASSVSLSVPEFGKEPDDMPIIMEIDPETLPPNIILVRSLEELRDAMKIAMKQLTPDQRLSDFWEKTIEETVAHEGSHVKYYQGMGAEEKDTMPGLHIFATSGVQPPFGSGILAYADRLNIIPILSIGHLETTKLGVGAAAAAPLSYEFRSDSGIPHLSEGDRSKLISLGYTSPSDLSRRIATYNESHPDKPLPPLTFPPDARFY